MNSLAIEKWLEERTGLETYSPGLERVKKAIETLKLEPPSKIITVAGTNGKGSVCKLLGATLSQKYYVARFTSPHLYKITERMTINETCIKESRLYGALKDISQHEFSLTYYEYLFIAFLYVLKDKWPEYILLEVGLGGRLDATNALNADIAVVSSISRDHQEYLGHRYDEILLEKLAIARKFLVTGFELNYLVKLTKRFCQRNDVDWTNIQYGSSFREINNEIVKVVLKLLCVNIPVKQLTKYSQIEISNKKIDFFSSHNPDAVRKLVQFLKQEHYNKDTLSYDLLVLSFSHRSIKDLVCMIKTFKLLQPKLVKKIIVTSFDHPKAKKVEVLREVCKINGIRFVKNIENEIIEAQSIMCSGSNYFYKSFIDTTSSLGQ